MIPMPSQICSQFVSAARTYDRYELIADGIIHAIALALGLAGAIILIVLAGGTTVAVQYSIFIYAFALLATFGFSAAYNMWPMMRVKWVLRRFDHSAIFVMIAGTYTPFLAQMKYSFVSIGFLAGVWMTAIIGIALKILLVGRLERTTVVLYLLLGWSGALAYKTVAAALPSISLWLLVTGGTLYSIGVIFHSWRRLCFQNAIWHTFVLVAACCHYMAVLFSIANMSEA